MEHPRGPNSRSKERVHIKMYQSYRVLMKVRKRRQSYTCQVGSGLGLALLPWLNMEACLEEEDGGKRWINTHKQADAQRGFDGSTNATEVDFRATVGTSIHSAMFIYVQPAIAYNCYCKSTQYCKLSCLSAYHFSEKALTACSTISAIEPPPSTFMTGTSTSSSGKTVSITYPDIDRHAERL